MSELTLQLTNGVHMVVPGSLESITTYVLLEQEAWFEKEVAFLDSVLRPGMTAIDIGANLGVYSLPMARLVGPAGKVIAYEPGSAARTLLERSKRLNGCDNLEIIGAALSDGEREGHLAIGVSSELNSLSPTGAGESVRVTSLDLEEACRGWASPEFVKIDAEGEEENILRGGQEFFRRHSPLVMFEAKVDRKTNHSIRAAFPAAGYRIYRLLRGAPILVPDRTEEPLDDSELNLFAAKPDRAAALARAGLLVDEVGAWQVSERARESVLAQWKTQPFAEAFAARWREPIDPEYRDALAAYAAWRSPNAPLAERCGALEFACRALGRLCERAPTFERLSTLARASFDAGRGEICARALVNFIEQATAQKVRVEEPFWPACPRFDRHLPEGAIDAWFTAAAVEHFERSARHSSIYAGYFAELDWLCRQPWATAELERRRILQPARHGRTMIVPTRLCIPAPDHLNAEVWRRGLVPNTFAAA